MDIYTVRPGDTLCGIALRCGVSREALLRANSLSDPSCLPAGAALFIPRRSRPPRREAELFSFVRPGIPAQALAELAPKLSYLSPFAYRFDASGALFSPDDAALLSAASAAGALPVLTAANLNADGSFSAAAAHALFTESAVREAFFANVLSVMEAKGFRAVNFDMQYLLPFDREAYNALLSELVPRFHRAGYTVFTTLAPKLSSGDESTLCRAHDYAFHGAAADRVIIMACSWGHPGTSPQSISPPERMGAALSYALQEIPAGKILCGFSCHGCSWQLPWTPGGEAHTLSLPAALALAAASGAQICFDSAAQAPYFSYTDALQQRHAVWFEDVRSIRARLELVRQYPLAGMALCSLSTAQPPVFELISSYFCTEKLP